MAGRGSRAGRDEQMGAKVDTKKGHSEGWQEDAYQETAPETSGHLEGQTIVGKHRSKDVGCQLWSPGVNTHGSQV